MLKTKSVENVQSSLELLNENSNLIFSGRMKSICILLVCLVASIKAITEEDLNKLKDKCKNDVLKKGDNSVR